MSNFPPASAADIAAYPDDDVVDGYRSYRKDDPDPGDNHAPGYRWGWANAKRDRGHDDGMDWVRSEYIAMLRRMH